jgi:hypothetical protein
MYAFRAGTVNNIARSDNCRLHQKHAGTST